MQAPAQRDNTLLMLSPVSVPDPDVMPLALPRKFADGVAGFAEWWQGPVMLLLPGATRRDDNLDYVPVQPNRVPFAIHAFPEDERVLRAYIQAAKLVFVPLTQRYMHSAFLCAEMQVPFALDADLALKQREDIVRVQTRNPLLRWRRLRWVRHLEQTFRTVIGAAGGIQLLGVSAYNAYAPLNRAPLLYFNTRMRKHMLVSPQQLSARAERLRAGSPLHLVYSGRWHIIKGVQDLPRVALALRQQHIHFELDIFGGGALASKLQQAVSDARLDNVHLHGELPFPELMRFAATTSDLFVCCHRQGDPSTTFMEMSSAGVPLVGYDREGLRGIVSRSGAGWLTPPDDVAALAACIAGLDRDRGALIAAAQAAAAFTATQSFEETMHLRAAHLAMVARGQ